MSNQRGDNDWQQHQQQQSHHHFYGQIPLLSTQYGSTGQPPHGSHQPQQQYGMGHIDRHAMHDDLGGYMPYSAGSSTSHDLMSPGYHAEQPWPTGMDLNSPTAFRQPAESIARYPAHPLSQQGVPQAHLTGQDHRVPASIQQQAPSLSPNQQPGEPMHLDQTYRPPMAPRSATAPVKGSRKSSARTAAESDDSDADLVPEGYQDAKSSSTRGGRKRQRIPHTAVERRYRENLNAHLERLRQAVPSLASRQTHGTTSTGQPTIVESAKPSKCEILNGAIEHIGNLNGEVQTLKDQNQELRTRVDELNRWYGASLRGGSGYPDPGGMGPAVPP